MKKNIAGIILTEALISVAMMATGLIIVSSIMVSAVETTKISKGYLVGQNLATEGVESVKSVRNTNWLLFSDTESCWLNIDNSGGCDSGNMNPPVQGKHMVPLVRTGAWVLNNGSIPLDLESYVGTMETYRLYLDENDVYQTNGLSADASEFYRSINFVEIGADYAVVEVTVQWLDGVKVRQIIRRFSLYNYL